MQIIDYFSIQNLSAFFRNKLNSFKPVEDDYEYLFDEKVTDNFENITKIGEAEIDANDEILVITAKSLNQLTSRSGKKKQFDIAKKILKEELKDAAFFVFYDDAGNFRFSFIRTNYIGTKRDFTDYKRYTYFVSPKQTNKTFITQVEKADFSNIDSILEAFSVKPLNEEFYKQISHHFYTLIGAKIGSGTKEVEYQAQMKLPSVDISTDRKTYQEFAVRLIGRTIFVWFLKNKKSDNNLPLIPINWLTPDRVKNNPDYYHSLLEKLFFEILNKPIAKRIEDLPKEHKTIPFLNGGLFEPNSDDFYNANSQNQKINFALKIPDQWFVDFYDTLLQFNFTIDENSIYDTEVSIDPEMLGTIFENLLAEIDPDTKKTARNATGSFYTPREIVDYMTEEALVQYLKNQTNEDEEILHLLFKENDLHADFFTRKNKIIEAFNKIKLLDPACGSGAFPMGALHKINMALQKLDPNAEIWKNKQLDKIDNKLYRDALKDKLDKSNVEYIRKLGIIQHSIYGVDIQPIATEISKLRSFLSLVVDENIKDDEPNRGIYPLPNLEFKFVTANTLIDLENKQTSTIDFGQTDTDIDKLQKIRNDYLQAYGEEKLKLKTEFLDLQKQIAFKENKTGMSHSNIRAQQITGWNPFSHEKSDWFNPKWMFGVEKFDVVVGNPPFIQLQKAINEKQKYADLYKTQNYKTFERTGDIYSLFYEKGTEHLAKKGLLCYITSNKWMRANYRKSLRKYFADKNPVKLIDMGPGVFNSATVDTNILLLQNAKNANKLQALTYTKQHNIEKLTNSDFITLNNLTEESWIILTEAELSIKQKIEKHGTPLKEWDININYGIKTGYNDAFIIDGKTKDELIAQDPKSAEIIKPILRGRDIQRYKANFADLWLIATFPALKLNIDDYPAVKTFLEGFKPKLIQEGKIITNYQVDKIVEHANNYSINVKLSDLKKSRKKTSNKWFETQDQIGYHKEFEKEKIVWASVGTNEYCFVSGGYLLLDTNYFAIGLNKYHLAILNSTLIIKRFIEETDTKVGTVAYRHYKYNFEKVPIPKISKAEQKPFEEKVEEIMRLKELGENTAKLEAEIDKMVYKLYNLNEEEIKIIEGV